MDMHCTCFLFNYPFVSKHKKGKDGLLLLFVSDQKIIDHIYDEAPPNIKDFFRNCAYVEESDTDDDPQTDQSDPQTDQSDYNSPGNIFESDNDINNNDANNNDINGHGGSNYTNNDINNDISNVNGHGFSNNYNNLIERLMFIVGVKDVDIFLGKLNDLVISEQSSEDAKCIINNFTIDATTARESHVLKLEIETLRFQIEKLQNDIEKLQDNNDNVVADEDMGIYQQTAGMLFDTQDIMLNASTLKEEKVELVKNSDELVKVIDDLGSTLKNEIDKNKALKKKLRKMERKSKWISHSDDRSLKRLYRNLHDRVFGDFMKQLDELALSDAAQPIIIEVTAWIFDELKKLDRLRNDDSRSCSPETKINDINNIQAYQIHDLGQGVEITDNNLFMFRTVNI